MPYILPTSVEVEGIQYDITNNGDFRMVLDCFDALGDEELSEDFRVLTSVLIFYNKFETLDDLPEDTAIVEGLIRQMFWFFNCGQDEDYGSRTKRPLIDWHKDSQMICSAINKVANMEVRALPELHWWTFMGYYMSVGESTLATVVSIRDKLVNNKKLEKWEREFKRDNPDYFVWNSSTVADRAAEEWVSEIWNSGG